MPRAAATVILLREADPPEALLIRRHQASGFFGGAHAFPGGKLDGSDCAETVLARLPPGSVARCALMLEPTPGQDLSPAAAAGLCVAACRELFEEAGVLLAHTADGATWQPPLAAELDILRRRIHDGDLGFADFLANAGLCLDVEALAYWSHWITPSLEPRRFDARFFVAAMPADQQASVDDHETTEQRWMTPAAAVAASSAGTIMLPPPTLRTLDELATASHDHAGVGAILVAARQRRVLPILPKIAQTPNGPGVVLPWDPLYAGAEGEALAPEPDYPGEWCRGPSRVVMIEPGRWAMVSATDT